MEIKLSVLGSLAMMAAVAACATDGEAQRRGSDPANQIIVPFFEAVAREDLPAAQAFLAPNAQVMAMFNPNGQNGVAAQRNFPAATYFGIVTRNYDNLVFAQRTFTTSSDGRIVWMEAQGELIVTASGLPYRNGYVFKFTLENGKIRTIQEWVNTVTLTQQGIAAQRPGQ
jgi:ketosteroid isomerase-like protein